MKILTVDDDALSRQLLRNALTSLGHDVIEAERGDEAWAAFRLHNVSIIISDWLMPAIDGLRLCQLVRTEQRPRYSYFIMLTVMEGRKRYLEAMNAGVDDFITKPFDVDTLASRLRVAERIITLQSEVRTLEGLLPICSYCKKIRDQDGHWEGVERYISRRTETDFSHGICPECYQRFVKPDIDRIVKKTQSGHESS